MLEVSRRNKHVFLKIATEMEQTEFSKSAEQCASKNMMRGGGIQKIGKVASPMSSAISADRF